jgi:hypothetical protein
MDDTIETTRPRRRRRLAALMLLTLSSGMLGAGALSLAIFTDTGTVGANVFTVGTVRLGLNPTTAVFSSGAMMPGDSVTGSLVVSNAGTAQFRYAMTSAWTNADTLGLRDQMTVTVRTLGTSCAAFDGTVVVASGPAASVAFGNPAQGPDAGDRTLDAVTSETLCFRATLPSGTGNAFQGATTTGTLTFSAEQTANNP